MPLQALQHAHPSHLVFLPELAQDVAVNGVLHKADIKALDAEVEVPKPEHETAGGREGGGLEGLRLQGPGSTAKGKHPQPAGSLSLQHRHFWEHQCRSALSRQLAQLPAQTGFLR